MADPADSTPTISDPNFQHAVELMDAGKVEELRTWIDARPQLLSASADEDGSFAGDYFANPKLIWFLAENPIRNGSVPQNVADVAQMLIETAKQHEVADLDEQLNYTLALVTSSAVARECSQQGVLARTLIAGGADPNAGILSALAHGERDVCELLLSCGAKLTLPLAAGLGKEQELSHLLQLADASQKQAALAMAAINAQPTTSRILLDAGVDPNQYNPDGMHAHSTPLHQAIHAGCPGTVCTLLTRGADMSIKDKRFQGDAMGWAKHFQREQITELLTQAARFMPAVAAIRLGEVEALQAWLKQHPDVVNATLGDNPRTLLHYATDWPGHPPRVGESIAAIIEAGANINSTCLGSKDSQETPLHWAASSDDKVAARALIDAGADLNPTGGCIANGTPLVLAVIFQNLHVATQLVQAGAALALPLAAGMGRLDLMNQFFDDSGEFHNPFPSMPHYDSVSHPQRELDGAICLAAMGGHMEAVMHALEHGANANMFSVVNTTPLDEAANNGHVELARYLMSVGAKTYDDLRLEEQ